MKPLRYAWLKLPVCPSGSRRMAHISKSLKGIPRSTVPRLRSLCLQGQASQQDCTMLFTEEIHGGRELNWVSLRYVWVAKHLWVWSCMLVAMLYISDISVNSALAILIFKVCAFWCLQFEFNMCASSCLAKEGWVWTHLFWTRKSVDYAWEG